jgi:hypothetical protein
MPYPWQFSFPFPAKSWFVNPRMGKGNVRASAAYKASAAAADALLDPGAPLWLADPGVVAVEFSRAMINAYAKTGLARSPEAAADVLRNAVTELRG